MTTSLSDAMSTKPKSKTWNWMKADPLNLREGAARNSQMEAAFAKARLEVDRLRMEKELRERDKEVWE